LLVIINRASLLGDNKEMGRKISDETRQIRNLRAVEKYHSNPEVRKRIKEFNNRFDIKERRFNNTMLRLYGITRAQYDNMLILQNGRCGICNDVFNGKICIDHCHRSGRVRGLLCDFCNRMLGQARDSEDILSNALEYVKIHG
jgi:hypothetical protein